MKFNKIVNIVSFLGLFLSLIFIFVLVFWETYPYKTLVINYANPNEKSLKVLNTNKEVKKGDTLEYLLDYCRYVDNEVLVSRRFIDGIVFSMPDVTAKNPKGCTSKTIGVEVPRTLPAGTYVLEVNYQYRPNPIRTISIYTSTESFRVIE